MTDTEAEATMKRIRWVDTNGQAVCSHCGSLTVYECRRPSGAPRWRCKDCGKDFSITSGTWRVARGGAWNYSPNYLRSAFRYWNLCRTTAAVCKACASSERFELPCPTLKNCCCCRCRAASGLARNGSPRPLVD